MMESERMEAERMEAERREAERGEAERLESQRIRMRSFLGILFRCMERRISYGQIDYSGIERDAGPHAPIVKRVVVFYLCLYPLFWNEFHTLFNDIDFKYYRIFDLLTAHSSKMAWCCENIFVSVMYICSFTHSLLDFAAKKSHNPMFKYHAATSVTKLFSAMCINKKFTERGGFDGLHDFCISNNLLEILSFIGECYSKQYMLLTQLTEGERVFYFALESEENLFILKETMQELQHYISVLFHRERLLNRTYDESILLAFERIRHLTPRSLPVAHNLCQILNDSASRARANFI